MVNNDALKAQISLLLNELYERRFAALEGLTLSDLLSKNPYLYRSLGINKHSELIDQLLAARISSSDETIFGNNFLEPLALWSAQHADSHGETGRKASVGGGAGFDIAIENSTSYLAIAVKSGKNIFNSQSAKGQNTEFDQLQARIAKMKKQFRKIIGYGYGRKSSRKISVTESVAGQEFWTLLTGESDYYLRIAAVIGDVVHGHAQEYKDAYDKKTNILVKQFAVNFVDDDGDIEWDRVVEFNSGAARPKRLKMHDEA